MTLIEQYAAKRYPYNDWEVLRGRYNSLSQYKKRKAVYSGDFEEFESWLIDQDAEIFAVRHQNEVFRYSWNGRMGVLYENGAGNLLTHDLAQIFKVG